MKKVLIGLFILVLLIGGGIYWVVSNLDYLVKMAIEQYGSQVTQTSVKVDKVKLDLQKGTAGIFGLTIANPAGFETKQAFSLGETTVGISLDSLGKPVLVLDKIVIRAPKVNYEMNADKQGSLNVLYETIAKSLPTSGDSGASGGESKMIIRSLVFEDAAIDALLVPVQSKHYKLTLPAIRMNNLGAPRGATPEKLAAEILARITRSARDQIKRELVDKQLKSAIDAERKKLESQAQQKVDAEKQKLEQQAKDQLKGLIKR